MVQKIKLIIFLIIGISLISIVGCGRKTVEIKYKGEYVYVNTFSDTIQLSVFDKYGYSSKKIYPKDSIIFFSSSEGVPAYPFVTNTITTRADSAIIVFKNKCTKYILDKSSGMYEGNGVFNLKEYDNYSQDLVNQKSYTLRYSIDSTDFKKAVLCK